MLYKLILLTTVLVTQSNSWKKENFNIRTTHHIGKHYDGPNSKSLSFQCPKGSFITSYKMFTANIGFYQSDKGLTQLTVYCTKPGSTEVTQSYTLHGHDQATEESETQVFYCDGLMNGFDFQVRNRKQQPFEIVDIKFLCSDQKNKEIESGVGVILTNKGVYSQTLKCLRRQAICGVTGTPYGHAYINGYVRDRLGFKKLGFICCPIPDPTTTCTPKDHFETVTSCSDTNAEVNGSMLSCAYTQTVGTEMEDKSSQGGSMSKEESASLGFSLEFEYAGVSASFSSKLSKSKTTGMAWNMETTKVFSSKKTNAATFLIPKGYTSELKQIVGTCGDFTVRPNAYVKVDTKIMAQCPPKKKITGRTVIISTEVDYSLELFGDLVRHRYENVTKLPVP